MERVVLPEVPLPSSDALRAAARRLVTIKDDLDDGMYPAGRALLRDMAHSANDVLSAADFLRHVLPFLQMDAGEEHAGRIALPHILSESWKWGPHKVHRKTPDEVMAYLLDDARADEHGLDRAEIELIEPLGIAYAYEGKNRIRFLREHGAISMPARIRTRRYPAAERIRIYFAKVGQWTLWFAVLDGVFVQWLTLPDVTLPLLEAYGVPAAYEWPSEFASPFDCLRSLGSRPSPGFLVGTANLRTLARRRRRERALNTERPASLDQLVYLKPRWRWVAGVVCALIGWFVMAALPWTSGWREEMLALGAGVVGGIATMLWLPLWMVPWRHTNWLPRRRLHTRHR